MIKVAGIWEQGWNTPIKEMDQWEMVLKEYNVNQFYMCPISGIYHSLITERDSLETVLKENPDITVVFVDEKAETSLDNFIHPENVLYIFGCTSHSAMYLFDSNNHKSVKIITPTNKGLLFAHQTAAVLLQDRFNKQ